MTLTPQTALKEKVQVTHAKKMALRKSSLKRCEWAMWHLHPPSFTAPMIEHRRGFGSYLFIYLFWAPVSLTFPPRNLWLSEEHSSCDPTLEGGMIKGSLGRLGKTFPLRMDILPVKRLFPRRWDSRSRFSGVTTWKGRIWPQSPTYMFFFPTRANGRHQP